MSRASARAQDSDGSTVDRTSAQDSFRNDFGSLLKAIQSDDVATAQTALASLKTDVGSSPTYSPSSSTSSTSSTGIDGDLKSMFDAVSNGDIGAAQSALTDFTSDVTAAAPQGGQGGPHRAHGHHHHGPPPTSDASTDDSTSIDGTSTGTSTSATDATSSDATAAAQMNQRHRRNHGLVGHLFTVRQRERRVHRLRHDDANRVVVFPRAYPNASPSGPGVATRRHALQER